jgi:hypothetical protein
MRGWEVLTGWEALPGAFASRPGLLNAPQRMPGADDSGHLGPGDRDESVPAWLLQGEGAVLRMGAPRERVLPSRLVARNGSLWPVEGMAQERFLLGWPDYPSAVAQRFVDGWVKGWLVPTEEALQMLAALGMLVVGFYIDQASLVEALFVWEALHLASARGLRLVVAEAWVHRASLAETLAVRLANGQKMLPE